MADAPEHSIRLSDGRTLAWAEYGQSTGAPALYFHGTPGGRLEGRLLDEAARDQHIRLIAVDRPGYGYSDFKPGRKLTDFPGDVMQLADSIGLDKFSVIGLSGGGPHAQACAAAIPERLTSATIVSGAGSAEAVLDGRTGVRWLFGKVGLLLTPLIGWLVAMWTAFWAPYARPWMIPKSIDRNVVPRPGMAALFLEETRDALRPGGRAMAQDLRLFARAWGFAPRDVGRVPVFLWHGEADRVVPSSIGRYFAREIPGCQARFFRGEEHLMIVDRAPDIFAAIARVTREQQPLTS